MKPILLLITILAVLTACTTTKGQFASLQTYEIPDLKPLNTEQPEKLKQIIKQIGLTPQQLADTAPIWQLIELYNQDIETLQSYIDLLYKTLQQYKIDIKAVKK